MEQIINKIIEGDTTDVLKEIPDGSVDLIFADPPYNLQIENDLYRPNNTKVNGVVEKWDKFQNFESYDTFTIQWLKECKRVLKENGSIWVIGTYHNIFRVGKILQDLGYWVLNDIIWIKTNPMPNFKGTRFTNAHETLIWATKHRDSKYIFNYKTMKAYNDDLQMRSDWYIPICQGEERIKINGDKTHPTQKPEALLYRIITSTSRPFDIVLDPFAGSGTTLAVAKKLKRRFIGIEREKEYVKACEDRIKNTTPLEQESLIYPLEKKEKRVPFGALLELGYIKAGEYLFSPDEKFRAVVLANGTLKYNEEFGSIHRISAYILGKEKNNGWDYWYVKKDGKMISINDMRKEISRKN
ncbi:DNA methyltransferase [Caldiplasma sukawensis]